MRLLVGGEIDRPANRDRTVEILMGHPEGRYEHLSVFGSVRQTTYRVARALPHTLAGPLGP